MLVTKRDGSCEVVKFEKILKRIQRQSKDLKNIDAHEVAQKVILGLYDKVTTKELDNLAIETAYSLSTKHPDYDKLALRLAMSKLHKNTRSTFSETIQDLRDIKDDNGNSKPIISEVVYKFVMKHSHVLNAAIDHNKDFDFDFFGLKTLEKSYLLRIKNEVVERPQYMWMRVACGIHYDDIDACLNTYENLSDMNFTHSTPTLFNAGSPKNSLAACYLFKLKEDSIEGIFDTIKDMALVSKGAGGIGLSIHELRTAGSPIYGTNGKSNGYVPAIKTIDAMLNFVDQGGSRRRGSAAIYAPDYSSDMFEFLDLRKNNGKEELRARDINTAVWLSDCFMKKVKNDEDWHLMDPAVCKGLNTVYDEVEDGEFTKLYNKYVLENKFTKKVKAREVWAKILESQMETGEPYLLSKDSINRKTNQKNLGVIESSNLCSEITEFTAKDEVAVCVLASISLPSCLEGKKGKKTFNFKKLGELTKILVNNLNKVIDTMYYPIEEARNSNMRHRPLGIGIQGLSDVFAQMRYPWESEEARLLNKQISETMYYYGLLASCDLSEKHGPYSTFAGSPASKGILNFDMWGVEANMYDWSSLKERIKKTGIRNSLLLCVLPSASTSQILGNTESVEVISSNIYKRLTLSGEFVQLNKYLVEDLIELGLWNDQIRQKIIAAEGSIQNIDEIPADLKKLYKTVWEMSQKVLIDMSADRAPFICQSQSLNLYFKDANFAKLTSAYFYGWEKGLKTIVYYTRTQNKSAQKFTVDYNIEKELKEKAKQKEVETEELSCSLDNPDACLSCGS